MSGHPTAITLDQVYAALAALDIPAKGTTMVTIGVDEVCIDGYAMTDEGLIVTSGGEPTVVSTTVHISREVTEDATSLR